jgi:hypothetical protein
MLDASTLPKYPPDTPQVHPLCKIGEEAFMAHGGRVATPKVRPVRSITISRDNYFITLGFGDYIYCINKINYILLLKNIRP